MTRWVYDSAGRPIAFIKDDKVFSRSGRFIGRLDGNEVWGMAPTSAKLLKMTDFCAK